MDPLIIQLVERARNNDPRLRHVSLRSLPLLEISHEEMYAVVESLQYNQHICNFDMSLHYDDEDQDEDDILDAPRNNTVPQKLPPPFESIFSRNTSLTDVRISSSCPSILGSVFRGLAYNTSVQVLQVGEMSATGETVNMDLACSVGLKSMLERNNTIHRLALQGFRWDDGEALRSVCEGLRRANPSLRVLELLQIVATIPTENPTANSTVSTAIPFDEETTYRSKLDKAEETVSKNLMAAIAAMQHLKRLCIIACDLSGMSLPTLLDEQGDQVVLCAINPTQQPKLEELRLVECELSGPGLQTLQQACANNPYLRILDVRSNQLEDDSCHALAEILDSATSLTKLILEDNNIQDDGLVSLCEKGLISSGICLQKLCLKSNDFGPRGVQTLAQALRTKGSSLRELDLSHNVVGNDGAAAMGCMLQSNAVLTDLVLENANLGGSGVVELCTGLASNRTLRRLNLSGNTFGWTGVQALSDLLKTQQGNSSGCCALSSLRLSSCGLGDEGVAALAKALENNIILEEIILPFNRFGDEGAGGIGESLPNWKGLQSLQIQFNMFSEKGFEKIVRGIAHNFQLKSVYLLNAGPSNRLIDTLFQDMQHYVRLNRAGRRVLNEKTLGSALWPHVLARAGRAYGPNGVFFLLRERPDVMSPPFDGTAPGQASLLYNA